MSTDSPIDIDLDAAIKHLRDREYMSGIARPGKRVKKTGEVFTPTPLVQEVLDQMPQDLFTDPSKTFCDTACGDGQFLSEILIRKLQNNIDIKTALSTIYGVDIMRDNVSMTRERLSLGRADLKRIVNKNIVKANSLRYDYLFGQPDVRGGLDFTAKKSDKKQRKSPKKQLTKQDDVLVSADRGAENAHNDPESTMG